MGWLVRCKQRNLRRSRKRRQTKQSERIEIVLKHTQRRVLRARSTHPYLRLAQDVGGSVSYMGGDGPTFVVLKCPKIDGAGVALASSVSPTARDRAENAQKAEMRRDTGTTRSFARLGPHMERISMRCADVFTAINMFEHI